MVARLDAHQHFWSYNATDYPWMGSQSILQQDYLPRHLEPHLVEHGLHGTVAIQARQTTGETDFLLALQHDFPFIRAIVGWADLTAETLPSVLEQYVGRVAGFRHQVEDEPDPFFMLRDDFTRGISELGRHGYTYDLLIRPHHLENAIQLIDRFPAQRFVIDHLAKPDYMGGFDDWRESFTEIARRDNVWCKLSGMVTQAPATVAGDGGWEEEILEIDPFVPFVDQALEAFTPARLMFGSDWPVCTLAATVDEVHDIILACIEKLSSAEQQAIMGETAANFYGITVD